MRLAVDSACILNRLSHMLADRCDGAARTPVLWSVGGGRAMSIQEESPALEHHAPNAILERMRRRISRVGILVALVSTVLTALAIFAICACASLL
jgi:hypothetical protein